MILSLTNVGQSGLNIRNQLFTVGHTSNLHSTFQNLPISCRRVLDLPQEPLRIASESQ